MKLKYLLDKILFLSLSFSTSAQDFTRTNIESFISTIKAGGFDGDGDIDFIASLPGFQPLRLFNNNGESALTFNFNEIITDVIIGNGSLSSNQLTFQLFNLHGQLVLSGQEGIIDNGLICLILRIR